MILKSGKFVSDSEVRRLRVGSYEEKINEIEKAVQQQLGETDYEIIATREGEAVLYSEGAFVLAGVQDDGVVLTPLDVEMFDQARIQLFIEQEASAIADLFIKGAPEKAMVRAGNLIPVVESVGFGNQLLFKVRKLVKRMARL